MSQTLTSKNVDIKYYYNKKSKYFEDLDHRDNTTGRITAQQFLKYLYVAYSSGKPTQGIELDFFINNSTDWLRITRIGLFAEVIDIEVSCLYSVMNERDDLREVKINNDHELFNYCDYLLNIPSKTNLTLYSDSSNESFLSVEEPIFEVKDKAEGKPSTTAENDPIAGNHFTENVAKANVKRKKFVKLPNQVPSGSPTNKANGVLDTVNEKLENQIEEKGAALAKHESSNVPVKNDNIIMLIDDQPLAGESFAKLLVDGNRSSKEPFLTIHVKDDVKKVTKAFRCSEALLVSKMGYFAGKNLENADINIHCNLNIFNWIMDWITKSDSINNGTESSTTDIDAIFLTSHPPLNSKNVVQFLICVSFLRIEELINICLCFCKNNMNEVLKSARNFSCLSNSILDRLADMFSNVEVEALHDKKDKIKSLLYCKLIMSLSLPDPEPWKGHFSSLAGVFKCTHCKKLVMNKIVDLIPCLKSNIWLNLKGEISVVHVKDRDWSLTEYIGNLKKELKCWRRVYWRLWAECHFLYCTTCKSYYSIYYYNSCFYHPDQPQFSSDQTDTSVVGLYPCCGAKAYKYQCVVHRVKGCRIKYHTPILKNNRASTDIMKLFERFQRFIYLDASDPCDVYSSYESVGTSPCTQMIKMPNSVTSLSLENSKNEVQWKLPYFIPEQKNSGLLLKGLVKTNQRTGTRVYPCWIPDASKNVQVDTSASSSVDLYNNVNEQKNKKTLVGLFMQLENPNIKNDYDTSNETLFYSSDDESNEEFESNDEGSESSIDDHCGSENNGSHFYQKNGWTIVRPYKQRRDRIKKSQRHATRINQDNQRESEEHTFTLANSILSRKKHHRKSLVSFNNKMLNNMYCKMVLSQNDKNSLSGSNTSIGSAVSSSSSDTFSSVNRSPKSVIWCSHTPLAGTYKRVESEWKTTKKYIGNLLANKPLTSNQPFNHLKMCFHRQDQNKVSRKVTLKQKLDLPQIPFQKESDDKMWFYDSRRQQMEYVSAVCKPVSFWKEYKSERNHLNSIDWNNVIALEQKWNGFLQLLDANEAFSVEDENHKTNPKSETIRKVDTFRNNDTDKQAWSDNSKYNT